MRRSLAICLLATAAAATTAAGSGVIVAPHTDPPGTPLFHTHAAGLYRLPLFSELPHAASPSRTVIEEEPAFDAIAVLVLAFLTLATPRLPRPTLRAVAELPRLAMPRPQRRFGNTHGPPRATLHD